MDSHSADKKPPTLEVLLDRRGIRKSDGFDDYQDYIEESQRRGVLARIIGLSRIFPQGSMHLALGRVVSTARFWTWRDKL